MGSAMIVAEYTIESVESSPFAQISYIIWRQGRQDAVVIDPGIRHPVDPRATRRARACVPPPSSTRTAMPTISRAIRR